MNYSIVITTFSLRFEMVRKLISQIRKFSDKEIIICINGEFNENFKEDYRKKMLELCLVYDSILPIFFSEMRSLSKMWNTSITLSSQNNILVLNDDLEIISSDIFDKIYFLRDDISLLKINNSFSHFLINRSVLNEVGWFDERLLGFGEEDGDITFRFLEKSMSIFNLNVTGVINIVSEIRQNIKPGIGKYSLFNREFMFNKKYQKIKTGGITGMFDEGHKKMIEDQNIYPYESFYWENKNFLSNF
jgi:hypothetical protein